MGNKLQQSFRVLVSILALMAVAGGAFANVHPGLAANVTNGLDVKIIAGYNLVVDSNVTAPSTYAPRVATVIGEFCNTSGGTLANVTGKIGNFAANTPGTYPARAVGSPGFNAQHPDLVDGGGSYAFTHLGGAADATRYIGSLAPGACSTQYWHFTYPACENIGGSPDEPNCQNDPVWGATNSDTDDLWLTFDIWGTSSGSGTTSDNESWTMTMRNEISAMANKIEPNGNPGGVWFNTDTSTVNPGETVTTNGILYRLGNINQGFDNDADGVPDYNAWLQPFGDASYDPSCFRLVETTGVLTVTTNTGDVIIPFQDSLYFTDLPQNNTDVVGLVYYTFLALGGACTIPISPYQEAASGSNNEKFNADYGTGPAPIQTFEPSVTLDKSGSPAAGAVSTRVDYTIGFVNTSPTADAGIVLSSGAGGGTIGLVVRDTVPNGMTYIANSAAASNSVPVPYTIRYSVDSGVTWSNSDPGNRLSTSPAGLVMLQWWLGAPLDRAGGNNSGTVRFAANLPGTAPVPPFVENCASGSFADSAPFASSCTVTMISGTNVIGDFVWWDTDSDGVQDAGESGINGVPVSLYYDKNGDGVMDDGDVFISTQTTAGNGAYSFTGLASGNFLVVVDDQDTDITNNRLVPTTRTVYAVTGLGTTIASPYNLADFGFGPVLAMTKALTSANPAYEGENVTWQINLTNTRPGDGTGQANQTCTYTTYGNNYDPARTATSGNSEWVPYTNAFGANEPNGLFASSEYANVNENIGITGFALGVPNGPVSSVDLLVLLDVVNAGGFRPTTTESLDVAVVDTTTGTNIYSISYYGTALNTWAAGAHTLDLPLPQTTVNTLQAGYFNGSRYTISLIANGGGGSFTGYLRLDAAGFRVSVDSCGGAADTIITVPLVDEYDPARFQFVSASPTPDSATNSTPGNTYNPAGLLTWNDLGPLYAGQTKSVTVVLKALAPPGTTAVNSVNYARVRNAEFANGAPVNDGNANANVNINPAGTIGDLVWNDINANGLYNPNGTDGLPNTADDERGLAGVTVYLCTTTPCNSGTAGVRTTVTDASGYYIFEAVRDGVSYYAAVNTTTLPNGGTGATNTHDRDGNNNSVTTAMTINNTDGVTTNDDINDADFGYTIPTLITGSIWHDYNRSATGTPDVGEEGLANVWVYVSDGTCTYTSPGGGTCPRVQTTATGSFVINLTAAGWNPGTGTTYNVIVDSATLPTGSWTQSYDTPNGSDGIPGTGDDVTALDHTVPVRVVAGGQGRADYSYYQTGSTSISGTAYADWNGDATQDTGEDGFDAVIVYLYEDSDGDGVIDPEDARIASTPTDASGNYTFTGLPADTYIVVVDRTDPDLPSDDQQTEDPDVGNGTPCAGAACDSDGSANTTGGSVSDVDFGYQPTGYGSIGDFVWADTDGDGLQDVGEAGLPNITVNLYVWNDDGDGVLENGEQGVFVATADTDADGGYLFENLPAGNYIVDVDETDAGGDVVSSTYNHDNDLTTPNINNDPMGVALAAGENFLDADFGFAPGGSIGDYIWQDNDGDGTWDTNEPGLSNVSVTLYNDVNGNGVYDSGTDTQVGSSTTTDSAGHYLFTDLPAGDYVVVATTPSGYSLTGDPNAYATGTTQAYPPYNPLGTYANFDGQYGTSLLGGRSDLTADFGYQPTAFLGDTVWIDADNDGVKDAGEYGIPFITVRLCNALPCDGSVPANVVATSETDENGVYSFGNIANGTGYYVQVDTSDTNWPSNVATTNTAIADPDGTADNRTNVTVNSGITSVVGNCSNAGGACSLNADFGYPLNGAYALNGTVFFDAGNNGGFYASGTDSPYEGITVYLRDSAGRLIATTTTAANGSYTFTNLPNGTYRVAIDTGSPQLKVLNATREPDADPCGGACNGSASVTISGSASANNDFGFFGSLDFGDLADTYNSNPTYYTTDFASSGPYHTLGTLYLGSAIDAEGDGVPDPSALSDDDNQLVNDDDGITRDLNDLWVANATVQVNVVTSMSGGYLVGWLDFNRDGDFSDAGEIHIFGNVPSGASSVNVTIPASYVTSTGVNARFRLYNGAPAVISQTGGAINGEVEDYLWLFGPTSIELASVQAHPAQPPAWLLVAAALLLLTSLSGVLALAYARRRR